MLFKKLFLALILGLGIFLSFSAAFALVDDDDLEVAWPPSPMGTDLTAGSTLTNLTQYLYEWGIALGGLAAFIALLIAGFMYLTSVGDPNKMADARGRIVWALAGLVLLLAAWLILNTINPDLTTLSKLEFATSSLPLPTTTTPPYVSTPCTSSKITTDTASTTIPKDTCANFTISTSTEFSAAGAPAKCVGSLALYSKTGCANEDILASISPSTATTSPKKFNIEKDIKSIKLFVF